MPSSLRSGGMMCRFEVLNPGSTSGEKVTFEAFDLSVSDALDAGWTTSADAGRADQRAMFTSYSRTIGIEFSLVALQRSGENSIQSNVEKMNIIGKAAMPHYVGGIGFTGRFVKFTIGKLFVAEYGYLNRGLSLTHAFDAPWHVDATGGVRPYITKVDFSLTMIGNKRPDANKTPMLYDKF